ncbi:WSC-domain-containing protein [Aureobasidium sp. EXF-10727]|nr:WSC-domain-containing protein [Aureobasidium sp. EXF-10727]
MLSFKGLVAILFASLFVSNVESLASTDTITWGGDNSRSGYQTNHNMDPSVVGGDSFGQLWRAALPGNFQGIGPEQIFSQPLVYTLSDGIQYVYIATTQNNLYKINAKTGDVVASRNMHVPFLTADLDGCVDINPTVGVTATGVIDPDTGIWYLTAKTYSDAFQNGAFSKSSPPGRLNGRYYFHAINTADLSEVSGFPKMIDGLQFRNNPNRMFIGGNQHARPGMLQVGDFIYTGWASHCVKWNFTGAVIGFHRTTGAVVEAFAMEGGPEPNTIPGAGVWMSGGGLAYDGKGSMFLASGNGYASQLSATGNSLPGRQPPTSLEEAAVNFAIGSDGKLTPVDFFMPWEKTQLDGADKDLGTSPLELLPTDVFKCKNVARMGVVTGKSGKTYWLNLDNLGGYQMGPNKLDAAVQVTQNENSVYAGAGVMPLGGGYIYINVIQYQTHVFKFSCSASGDPQFTLVSNTPEKNAYILGVGHGTTTSLNGQEGTGLLWTTDVEGLNLRIYNAIPPSDGGNLQLIKSFNIPGVTKFSRPVFGNGIAYVGTTQGYLYAFGSPVNLPLNCSSPYTLPNTAIGNVSDPTTITCTANIGVTVNSVALTGNANFKISSVATPLTLTAGQTFTLNATFAPTQVGLLSSDILVNTTNSVAKYSSSVPITLKGTANSKKPLLAIAPNTVSFNVIAGGQVGGTTQSSLFSNRGDGKLTVNNITWSVTSETGPWIQPNVSDSGNVQVGFFTFSNLPTTIDPNSVATVNINYNPDTTGNHAVYVKVNTDGGSSLLDVVGRAGSNPSALIEFQTSDGSGWVTYQPGVPFSFGNVLEGQTRNLKMRVTNNGTGSAVPLSLTVSKPPYGVPGIIQAVNTIDLAEGTLLQANESQTATLYCSVPRSQVNVPSYYGNATWTINTGDPNMGKQIIQFVCNAAAEQVGPLLANGTAQYGYVGCFKENNPGRQLSVNPLTSKNMTNEMCLTKCASLGYLFSATQYMQECWCGNARPLQMDLNTDCNFNCAGNENQTCGGNGYTNPGSHMSLFADSTRFDGNTSTLATAIVPSYNGYNYMGCYAETGGRTINAASLNTNDMTIEKCGAFCIGKGYSLFGVEYAQECYCGNTIAASSKVTVDSKCSMTCKGSNAEFCGAGSLMMLYGLNAVPSSSSSVIGSSSTSSSSGTSSSASTSVTSSSVISSATTLPTSVLSNYTYMGCYNETHDRRALNGNSRAGSTNSLDSCATFCTGYAYFGVEYGSECYCGSTIYANSILQSDETGCSVPCAANASQKCGGADFLNVYYINVTSSATSTTTSSALSTPTGPVTVQSVGSFSHMGCYTEATNGRALTGLNKANSSVSVDFCASYCSAYTYFGVEYGTECYCGNVIQAGSVPTTDGRCKMTCAANSTQICGGSSGLNMYQKISSSSSSSSSSSPSTLSSTSASVSSTMASSSSSVSASSTTSTSASTSVAPSVVAGVSFAVEKDTKYSGTVINTLSRKRAASDLNSCMTTCANSAICVGTAFDGTICTYYSSIDPTSKTTVVGTTFATVQDRSAASSGSTVVSSSSSSGSSTSSVVSSTSSVVPSSTSSSVSSSSSSVSTTSSSSPSVSVTPTGPVAKPTVGSYVYQGCWKEIGGRALQGKSFSNSSNSLEFCAKFCAGYTYFATEYSSECYCSNAVSSLSGPATDGRCNMVCSADKFEYCGGANGLSLYKYDATLALSSSSSTSSSQSSSVISSSSASSTSSSISSSSVSSSPSSTVVSSSDVISSTSSSSSQSSTASSSSVSSTSPSVSSTSSSVSPTSSSSVSASDSATSTSSSSTVSSATSTSASSSSASSSTDPSSSASSSSASSSSASSSSSAASSTITSSASSSSTASTTSSSSTSTSPTIVPTVSGYAAQGCYSEASSGRALTSRSMVNATGMTPAMCASFCSAYAWFGVEYGQECYCGPYPRVGSTLQSDNSTCNMLCPGDKSAYCGAGNRLNMYYSSNSTKASTDPMNLNTTGAYSYYACVKDNPRALSVTAASDTMSVDACQKLATAGGYLWFGTEYGRECWMGNTLAAGAANATASDCNMACSGMPGQLCGGGSRLSLYKRTAN